MRSWRAASLKLPARTTRTNTRIWFKSAVPRTGRSYAVSPPCARRRTGPFVREPIRRIAMTDSRTNKAGLGALLTPENSVVVLIDHQPFQFANLHSHEPTMIINNVIGLAKTAKVFDVP